MNDENGYVLGTDENELTRLGFQHQIWSEFAENAWNKAGFGIGDTLLDIGCGPGFTSLDLSRLVGNSGKVIALDLSHRFIKYLNRRIRARGLTNIKAEVANVEKLALPKGSCDGAFARWVLCFTKDPKAVIEGAANAIRKNGTFVLQDYYNYNAVTISPKSEIFDHIYKATGQAWIESGGNPDIGKDLPEIMTKSGLEIKEINPIVRIARPDTSLWKWPESFLKNYIPKLIELKLITESERIQFEKEWEMRSKDDNSFYSTPPMIEIIAVKR